MYRRAFSASGRIERADTPASAHRMTAHCATCAMPRNARQRVKGRIKASRPRKGRCEIGGHAFLAVNFHVCPLNHRSVLQGKHPGLVLVDPDWTISELDVAGDSRFSPLLEHIRSWAMACSRILSTSRYRTGSDQGGSVQGLARRTMHPKLRASIH